MSANYVARELGYGASDEWGPFDAATAAAFEPLETFEARFDAVLGVDHVRPGSTRSTSGSVISIGAGRRPTTSRSRVTPSTRHGVRLVSLAGSIGEKPADVEAACRLANDLDVDLIAGPGKHRPGRSRRGGRGAAAHGVGSGSRTTPSGRRARCSRRSATKTSLGAAVDTGWWATQGYDPVDAIRELSDRLFHVHLKDVEEPRHARHLHARRRVRDGSPTASRRSWTSATRAR